MASQLSPSPSEVRRFLIEKFNDEELATLCFDYFPQVQENFTTGMTKGQKILQLLEYCRNRDLWPNLVAALQKTRAGQFEQVFGAVGRPVVQAIETPTVVARDPHQIFISHAHQDAQFAHRLAADLRQHGWRVWISPDSIRPGERWVPAIERGLAESGVFLAVVTSDALRSRWVRDELYQAIELEHEGVIRLIPVQAKLAEVAGFLRNYQYVSFLGQYEAGLRAVLAELGLSASEGSVEIPKVSTTRDSPRVVAAETYTPPEVVTVQPIAKVPTLPDMLVLESPFRLELARVPAGEFLMGSDPTIDKDAQPDEQSQHRVNVAEFYIGKYPVTNAQYAVFAQANGIKFANPKRQANHPVVNVSWDVAVKFCEWLSQATGKQVRLPTEAEWEKAARGADGRIYPWGNKWNPDKLNSEEGGVGDTTPVGKYSPGGDSPYGVADMAGNVWEWTSSLYEPYPYRADDGREDQQSRDRRVVRGGSWFYPQHHARAAYRFRVVPDFRLYNCGFRVVAAPVS